ncbi:MAG: cation:proton antiporter [Planctomycetota bacterium]
MFSRRREHPTRPLAADWSCRRLRVPGLVAMLLVGIAFGPFALGWISDDLLSVSSGLRLSALIVILLRAGFELSKRQRVGDIPSIRTSSTLNARGLEAAQAVSAEDVRIEGMSPTFPYFPKLGKIWVLAEIVLFAMVGAQVNLGVAALITLGLVARSVGSWLCLLGTNLTFAERWFVVISYIPKATVQAAIGGSPLLAMRAAGMDTAPGEVILAVAVLSILLTAPLGAVAITAVGNRVLEVGDPDAREAIEDVPEPG